MIELIGSLLGIAGAIILIFPSLKLKAIAITTWLISNVLLIMVTMDGGNTYMAGMFIFYGVTNAITLYVTLKTISIRSKTIDPI